MIQQPSSPTRQRSMAVKVAVVVRPSTFQRHWLWLVNVLVAVLVLLMVSGALILIR